MKARSSRSGCRVGLEGEEIQIRRNSRRWVHIVGSCGECSLCTSNIEQYCSNRIFTYNGIYKDGIPTQGGFSSAIVVHHNRALARTVPFAAQIVDGKLLLVGATKPLQFDPVSVMLGRKTITGSFIGSMEETRAVGVLGREGSDVNDRGGEDGLREHCNGENGKERR
ncbi:hypothetical protein MRB53_012693 [Persea americana]|uniref:Uncharacterized protein n=1 Tax=Persea americana TaxID=3435 RepID=A0ACC2LY17_PERAE|nr:hypothetical protein MRB53_012693 [Persea americana]